MEVTTKKVKSFNYSSHKKPQWSWSEFRGFSLLFDNPGKSISPGDNNLLKNEVDLEDEKLKFYKTLFDTFKNTNLDLLTEKFGFCPLPCSSYHVTVWNGFNETHTGKMEDKYNSDLKKFLKGLPGSLIKDKIFTPKAKNSVLTDKEWNIEFQVYRIWKTSNTIIVLLEPRQESDQKKFQKIKEARKHLYEIYEAAFNINLMNEYYPHLTLGYFANEEKAENIEAHINKLNECIQENTKDKSIIFPTVDLYGFTDMTAFFKTKSS